MKECKISRTDLVVSRLAFGCANLIGFDKEPIRRDDLAKAARLIHTACDHGITLFDHADVYAFGKAETVFGEVLKQSPALRHRIVIQSKCGQCVSERGVEEPIYVDLSRRHIVEAAEGSLRRLETDWLDILLLHAADALVEPEEVAQAFDDLHKSGKVRYFGVSNHDANQIALLGKRVSQPLVVNQLRLSVANPTLLAEGMQFTLWMAKGVLRSTEGTGPLRSGTIDYCRQNDIQVQAWSPLRGILNPSVDASPQLKAAAKLVALLAQEKGTTSAAIALAWLLRHPAGIVPILGASDPGHLIENCEADGLVLSREEWYRLFAAAA